ncbi:MAG: flavocytochrome c, partial [Fusobacteriaceae bacterium]
ATEKGAKVILIEKMPMLGGNTNYATGGLNAANTSVQKLNNYEDSEELFVQDTMKGGKDKNNKKLVEKMSYKSKEIIEWLSERGADLSELGRLAGQNKNRTHRPLGGSAVGPNIVSALSETSNKLDLDIRLNQKAINLLEKNGEVIGVEILLNSGKTYKIFSKAVIVTTGGFGANFDMVTNLVPELKGFGTTNHKGALGEGIAMLEKIGADMTDLDQIQTHPTVVPSNSEMITEAVRGNGAILVNREGKRFINELETRDVVSKAELAQEKGTAYLVFDQGVRKSSKAIEKYYRSGLLTRGKNLEQLAKKINIPYESLKISIEKYNGFVVAKKDEEFSRGDMPRELNQEPYFAVEVGPAIHHTMGGVKINEETEVLRKNKPIKGLYAAGEITGGIHGANRLGGNAMTDITVFGKIAGEAAAKLVMDKK